MCPLSLLSPLCMRGDKEDQISNQVVSVFKNVIRDILHHSLAGLILLIQIPFSISTITLQEQESLYCLTFENIQSSHLIYCILGRCTNLQELPLQGGEEGGWST